MPDLIIKPTATSGNKLILQDQGSVTRLQTDDAGITIIAPTIASMANCTFPVGHIVKSDSVQTQALVTGTTAGPYLDDTIPQNTEGDQILSLAFTPTSATNKLRISVKINTGINGGTVMGALFQDTTANALASCLNYVPTADTMYSMGFDHTMVAGTTSSTTFKVRVGSQISHTISINGVSGGRIHGGSCVTSMIIKEVKV